MAPKKVCRMYPFTNLPPDIQSRILAYVPLRNLAQVASLCKGFRALYLERVMEREEVVSGLLESHFTAEFREGLYPADTALPRDLIVDPPVRAPYLRRPVDSTECDV
jgi:hypothetical protein